MKKLHLLRPEEKICFLNEGRGERVRYLKIEKELDLNCLEEDVASGAKHMDKMLKMVERSANKLSRVVVLRGNNEESLLLAANYLAGVCNQQAIIQSYDSDDSDMDYTEAKCLFEEADYELTEGDEDEDEGVPSEWRESAYKLPVIEMSDLQNYYGRSYSMFGSDLLCLGGQQNQGMKPYWTSCHKEPVAVIIRKYDCFSGDSCSIYLERFQNNRHIFLLVLEAENELGYSFNEPKYDPEEEAPFREQRVMQLILENIADVAWIGAGVKENAEYYGTVFENQVVNLGYRLAEKFSVKEVVKKITVLRNPRKAELIESILKYVVKERRKAKAVPLVEKDFDVLSSFQFLSEEPGENQKSVLEKMEEELVGMDNVKRQIKNIVQTAKYAKYREKMGLGKNNIHNVFLLLGAPGTAKSSIAKLLGQAMFREKLLPDNRFICVNGAELKGRFVGHTVPRIKDLFEQHDVIMIDEAYSLTSQHGGQMDSFGQEALAQLMIELEDNCADKLVLFSGYGGTNIAEKDNKMREFLDGNPGLKSRINGTIFFDSYRPEEMVQIVHSQAKQMKLAVSSEADEMIRCYFEKRSKAPDFGNGREARSLVENALRFAAERVMAVPESKRTKKMMSELAAEDIRQAIESLGEGNLLQRGKQRTVCSF